VKIVRVGRRTPIYEPSGKRGIFRKSVPDRGRRKEISKALANVAALQPKVYFEKDWDEASLVTRSGHRKKKIGVEVRTGTKNAEERFETRSVIALSNRKLKKVLKAREKIGMHVEEGEFDKLIDERDKKEKPPKTEKTRHRPKRRKLELLVNGPPKVTMSERLQMLRHRRSPVSMSEVNRLSKRELFWFNAGLFGHKHTYKRMNKMDEGTRVPTGFSPINLGFNLRRKIKWASSAYWRMNSEEITFGGEKINVLKFVAGWEKKDPTKERAYYVEITPEEIKKLKKLKDNYQEKIDKHARRKDKKKRS